MSNESQTKVCKHCKSEIPKKAKVCPQCRKKQGGIFKWILIVVIVAAVIAVASGGDEEGKVKKTGQIESGSKIESDNSEIDNSKGDDQGDVSNIFHAGDIVETDKLKITFLSSEKYETDNEFLGAKEGYEYWKFEFKFENISDSDQTVSSMIDWECYADNSKVDQSWIGGDNGLDATLSSGRTTQGSLIFEVPTDAQKIELEYGISFWNDDKIIFIGK